MTDSSSEAQPNKHIRPRVRKKLTPAASLVATETASDDTAKRSPDDDQQVEETRQQIESWMGVGSEKESISNKKSVPTGILKKTPKYSKKVAPSSNPPQQPQQPATKTQQDESPKEAPAPQPKPIVQPFIVERDPTRPLPPRNPRNRSTSHQLPVASHRAVEGYEPAQVEQTSNDKEVTFQPPKSSASQQESIPTAGDHANKKDDEEEDPLILGSLAELLEAAGETLPENKITPDTQLVEADISFNCMTATQFEEARVEHEKQKKEDFQEQAEMFHGREELFDSDDDDEEGSGPEEEDDDFLDILMEYGDAEDEEEEVFEPPPPRAFIILWDVLKEWSTPQAVEWIQKLETNKETTDLETFTEWTPQVDRSDVGASRCSGLMTMINMNLPKLLEELGQSSEMRRLCERRLADWLRTFDYSMPSPKLSVPLWKAMTCILLEIILVERREQPVVVPKSIEGVSMTVDEYRYLTRSALQSLGEASTAVTN